MPPTVYTSDVNDALFSSTAGGHEYLVWCSRIPEDIQQHISVAEETIPSCA